MIFYSGANAVCPPWVVIGVQVKSFFTPHAGWFGFGNGGLLADWLVGDSAKSALEKLS